MGFWLFRGASDAQRRARCPLMFWDGFQITDAFSVANLADPKILGSNGKQTPMEVHG